MTETIELDATTVAREKINIRAGFHHLHSGETECGIAYYTSYNGKWHPCSKLINHDGFCGYQDNTCY